MSMNRRDWLSGVVTSVVGAQLAIAAKGPVEGIIMPDTEIKLFQPKDMPRPGNVGDILFVQFGADDYRPIGVITEMQLEMHRDMVDTTSLRSSHREFYSVRRGWEARGSFVSMGEAQVRTTVDIFKQRKVGVVRG